MTIPRVRDYGWARGEVISAAEMEQLDINHARAIDGCGGGPYLPSSLLVITDGGLSADPFGEIAIEGRLTLGLLGRFQWRVDTTTINGTALQTIDSRHDIYYAATNIATPNVLLALNINLGGHKVPTIGERLRIVLPYPNATTTLHVYSQGGGAPLVDMGPMTWPPCVWADFIYAPGEWRLSAYGEP